MAEPNESNRKLFLTYEEIRLISAVRAVSLGNGVAAGRQLSHPSLCLTMVNLLNYPPEWMTEYVRDRVDRVELEANHG